MNDLTMKLVNIIDETYLFHAGPIGSFICEEALDDWKESSTPCINLNLPVYIDALAAELPDESHRKDFAKRLLENDKIVSQIIIAEHLKFMSS